MAEMLYLGDHRIAYQAGGFVSGLTVTADIYKPDDTWDNGKALTALGSGLYYVDYNFPNSGSYIARFYENGALTAYQTYRVFQVATNVTNVAAIADAVWDEDLSGHKTADTAGYYLSSTASGGTGGGGGATAAQVWSYGTRTLTDGASSEEIRYISSQITWISSNIQYTGGGGGGTKYVGVGGRKSPWTYRQKEIVLEKIDDIVDLVKDTSKKIDKTDKDNKKRSEEIKDIATQNLEELESTKETLEKIIADKTVQDKSITNINNELETLNTQIETVKSNLSSNKDIEIISKQINSLCDMLAKSLSDKELEELINKYSK